PISYRGVACAKQRLRASKDHDRLTMAHVACQPAASKTILRKRDGPTDIVHGALTPAPRRAMLRATSWGAADGPLEPPPGRAGCGSSRPDPASTTTTRDFLESRIPLQ